MASGVAKPRAERRQPNQPGMARDLPGRTGAARLHSRCSATTNWPATPWLYASARRAALDVYRRQRRFANMVPLESVLIPDVLVAIEPVTMNGCGSWPEHPDRHREEPHVTRAAPAGGPAVARRGRPDLTRRPAAGTPWSST